MHDYYYDITMKQQPLGCENIRHYHRYENTPKSSRKSLQRIKDSC